jgi:hypothetical protein
MEYFILVLLVIIVVLIGIGLLFYFLPKKLGYPKIAKYLAVIFGCMVFSAGFYLVFEDLFFTKNNAKELVEEQGLILTEDFELLGNNSMSGIGDYYHTFSLKISESDKQKMILQIKSAKNFKIEKSSSKSLLLYLSENRYFGPKVTQNYETENTFNRAYFKPSGKQGYAPTFRRISISKVDNELTFEDIVE